MLVADTKDHMSVYERYTKYIIWEKKRKIMRCQKGELPIFMYLNIYNVGCMKRTSFSHLFMNYDLGIEAYKIVSYKKVGIGMKNILPMHATMYIIIKRGRRDQY